MSKANRNPRAVEMGKRLRELRTLAGFSTEQDLAEALQAVGDDATRRWVGGVEIGDTFRLSIDQLIALKAAVPKLTLDYLVAGETKEEGADSAFVANMRVLGKRLDPSGKATVEAVAIQQAIESDKRRAAATQGLSEGHRELVERTQDPAILQRMLEVLRAESENPDGQESMDPSATPQTRRQSGQQTA